MIRVLDPRQDSTFFGEKNGNFKAIYCIENVVIFVLVNSPLINKKTLQEFDSTQKYLIKIYSFTWIAQ